MEMPKTIHYLYMDIGLNGSISKELRENWLVVRYLLPFNLSYVGQKTIIIKDVEYFYIGEMDD